MCLCVFMCTVYHVGIYDYMHVCAYVYNPLLTDTIWNMLGYQKLRFVSSNLSNKWDWFELGQVSELCSWTLNLYCPIAFCVTTLVNSCKSFGIFHIWNFVVWDYLLTLSHALDFCEPCPSNGLCYEGKLECAHGYRKLGDLCLEDSKVNEAAKELVCLNLFVLLLINRVEKL